jgi:hypothetical protein
MILELGCAQSSEFIACIVTTLLDCFFFLVSFLPASVLVPAFYKSFAHEFLTNRIMLAHANIFSKITWLSIRLLFESNLVRGGTKPSRDFISP